MIKQSHHPTSTLNIGTRQRARKSYEVKIKMVEKVIKKFGLVGLVTVFLVVLFSFSSFVALAQYETTKTADFTISSSGVAHVDQSTTAGDVSIDIAGTNSAPGSVTTATYSGILSQALHALLILL